MAGSTGSLIAFYNELDHALNPALFRVVPRGSEIDVPGLIEIAEMSVPDARVTDIILHRDTDQSVMMRMEPRIDPLTGEPYVLDFTELYLDPYTGQELGRRKFADITQGLVNLMPFIYRFHYSLALGQIGTWLLGIVAFVWTFDCFIGFYLTLPARRISRVSGRSQSVNGTEAETEIEGIGTAKDLLAPPLFPARKKSLATRRGFWSRWGFSWKVKWHGSGQRINFDLHRAGGLWVWPMLLVFAWSAVAFNLSVQIYQPVMRVISDFRDPFSKLSKLTSPMKEPGISWREALRRGHELMTHLAAQHDFVWLDEQSLALDRMRGVYRFSVFSDRDIGNSPGSTTVLFDADNGELKAYRLPTGQYAGNTVTNWLYALHQGEAFGLAYRILVCAMGWLVVLLSVTGMIIWSTKRRRKSLHRKN